MPPIENQYKAKNQEFLHEYAQRPRVIKPYSTLIFDITLLDVR